MSRELSTVYVEAYTFDTLDGAHVLARFAWIPGAYESEMNDGTGWKTVSSDKAHKLAKKLRQAGAEVVTERLVRLDLLDWDGPALTAALELAENSVAA